VNDQWVLNLRGPKAVLDPTRASGATWEEERDPSGALASTAVIFLTNRECPFRCVMCDLWVHTLDDVVPDGAIAGQIRVALAALPRARQIKLYNAGSFFDAQAIPPSEDESIADVVAGFERVIVEAHPAYLRGPYGERCLRFRDLLRDRNVGQLEVAIGLETAHPEVLDRLNKRMTMADFRTAGQFLREHGVDMRAFILLKPPFLPAEDTLEWTCRSLDAAFDAGATVCSVIPTRGGNGAMEALGAVPPALTTFESVLEYGVAIGRGRVFADLWDVERLSTCRCAPARVARLRAMNETQRIPAPVLCDCAARR
jgi:archaeosine synthase beta-subunit